MAVVLSTVLSALAAACGSGDPGTSLLGAGRVGEPVFSAMGIAKLPDPPPEATEENGLLGVPVAAHSGLMFYGRTSEEERDGAGFVRNHSEAWQLDTRTGTWRRLPDPPVRYPFDQSTLAAFGTDAGVVIVGTPCTRIRLDEEIGDEPSPCEQGDTLTAIAWSAAAGSWRRLGSPPGPVLADRYERSGRPMATALFPVGWTGAEVVMWPARAARDRSLLLLDPSTGTWRWSDPVPVGVGPTSICISEGRVVGVPVGGTHGSAPLASEDPVADRVRAFALDGASLRWEEIASAPRDGAGVIAEELACPYHPDGPAVYVGSGAPTGGAGPVLMRLDVHGRRWVPLPAPDGFAAPRLRAVPLDGGETAYIAADPVRRREAVLVPTADATAWREAPAFQGETFGALIPLSGARFVVPGRAWRRDATLTLPPEGLLVDLRTWVARRAGPAGR
jgi:hypothetical protein